MKKLIRSNLLFLVFLFMILCPLSIKAQQGQVTKKTFEVKEGKIIIYLPDLSSSSNISGTVYTEPSGKTSKAETNNLNALKTYQLELADLPIIVLDNRFSLKLPPSTFSGKIPIQLKNSQGQIIMSEHLNITVPATRNADYFIPAYMVGGDPAAITGNFDGNMSNTSVTINGEKTELLAESKNQLFFNAPSNISGAAKVTCNENGKVQTSSTNILKLDLTADKVSLLRGQQTQMHIKVSGLEGLKENVPLTVNCLTNSIALQGGSNQQITINPQTDARSGVYETSRNIQALNNGGFTINVNVVPPTDPSASRQLLCNCYLNNQTHLIPPVTCITLGGTLNPPPENNNQTVPPVTGTTYPPPVSISQQGTLNEQTGRVNFQLTDPSNAVAAVIFSERPVSGSTWNQVGNAAHTGTNWDCNWTVPLGNDGEYIIRARIADKNNIVTERFINTYVQLSSIALNPVPGENYNLSVTNDQIRNADQKTKQITDSLRKLQERLDALYKKYNDLRQKERTNKSMAGELEAIDQVLDPVPGLYRDSLKALIDSLENLKTKLPDKIDPAALQKAADDAAQRAKDCQDRLDKLKAEKDKAQKELDAINNQIENLLKQMDQLHLGNNWVGGHGYHSDGGFWYGYVGDERSNTNINPQSNALSNQLNKLKGPQNKANNRAKALNTEIAAAEAECNKLKEEQEKADEAAKNGNQHAATETQVDELCRQIESLMDALKNWCAAHPGVCNFDPAMSGNPRTPAELEAYMAKLENIIKKKQEKEADLKKDAEANGNDANSTENDINNAEDNKNALEGEKARAQAAADQLRAEREKQLEAERAQQRKKQEEDNARRNTPKPEPVLSEPIYPSEMQLKFQAIGLLRQLYWKYWIGRGRCDCITKAIALANNSNTAATDIIGGMAVGVAFAPLEAFPGFSLAARLGIGAAKALGSAIFGGEKFTDELAKNLFNVIGGEIFPKLVGNEIAGNSLNTFAGKGLEAILKEEGVKATSWEGETELRGCGKVKGKTTMLFNPNTGWVTLLIKIDNCPLIVIKYKVNKDGVPVSKPIVTKVNG